MPGTTSYTDGITDMILAGPGAIPTGGGPHARPGCGTLHPLVPRHLVQSRHRQLQAIPLVHAWFLFDIVLPVLVPENRRCTLVASAWIDRVPRLEGCMAPHLLVPRHGYTDRWPEHCRLSILFHTIAFLPSCPPSLQGHAQDTIRVCRFPRAAMQFKGARRHQIQSSV